MTAGLTERPRSSATAAPDQVRAMVVAARLYHVHGLRQREIGARLGMSQARVSRLLQQAERAGVVRTVVAVPDGIEVELEEELERRYDVPQVHVVGVEATADVAGELGRAAADYLGEVGLAGEVVGFTSWSTTLQEMAHALAASARPTGRQVVEMLGDLGSPLRQHAAARSTMAMARALGAEPVFLRTPGVAETPELRDAALRDVHVRRALDLLGAVDVAFVGVGPADVHSQLEMGDRYFTAEQLAEARAAGAVGQLNQRFIDRDGRPVTTPHDGLVVGCTFDDLRAAARRVLVAGGEEKQAPLAAALRGGWADVLITDATTARALLADAA